LAVQYHGQRVAPVRRGGENIDLFERPVLGGINGAGQHAISRVIDEFLIRDKAAFSVPPLAGAVQAAADGL
jgi:hypothetical protein